MLNKIILWVKEQIFGIQEQPSISELQAQRKRVFTYNGQNRMIPVYDNGWEDNVIDYVERYQPNEFSKQFYGSYPVTITKQKI